MTARIRGALASSITAMLTGQDGPRTVIVGGPAGIGKISLIAAVTDDLTSAGRLVRWAGCTESSVRAPFGVVLELIGRPVVTPPAPNTADLVLERVAELADERPLVLVVDDAHRADADSLTVLWRLGLAATDVPIRLLLARRRQPPRELLTLLASHPLVAEIDVGPLASDEVAILVDNMTGAAPSGRLLHAVAVAGGSPLHVAALVRSLDQQGALVRVGATLDITDDALLTPLSLVEAVSEQVASTSGPARELLRVLAVWGRPATPADLADMIDTTIRAGHHTRRASRPVAAPEQSSTSSPGSPTRATQQPGSTVRQRRHSCC